MKNIKVFEVRNKISSPLIINENEPIEKIAEKFIKSPVNRSVYIVDEAGIFVGYINITLLLNRVLLDMIDSSFFFKNGFGDAYSLGKLSKAFLAKDFMRVDDITVLDDDLLARGIKIMNNYNIQELPVVDKDNKVIGDLNMNEIILAWENKSK